VNGRDFPEMTFSLFFDIAMLLLFIRLLFSGHGILCGRPGTAQPQSFCRLPPSSGPVPSSLNRSKEHSPDE
jgi:hypothetical protein